MKIILTLCIPFMLTVLLAFAILNREFLINLILTYQVIIILSLIPGLVIIIVAIFKER